MTSRLISSIIVPATANVARMAYDGGATVDVTIPAGTYYWSCDDAADDFALALKTAMDAACVGVFSVDVCGVDGNPATVYGEGRVVIDDSGGGAPWRWMTADAGFTLDARILGYVPGAAAVAAAATQYSPHVHRYGWYPQTVPMQAITARIIPAAWTYYSDGRRAGHVWSDADGRKTIDLRYDLLPAVMCRIDAAADSDYGAADYLLTAGDLNCAWERFALDCSSEVMRDWRYYPDTNDEDTYHGAYAWPDKHALITNPMATWVVRQPAGEYAEIVIPGLEAIT